MSKTEKNKGVITQKSNIAYFLWEIPNFCTSCYNIGDSIFSPEFITSYTTLAHWRLKMYPKSPIDEYKDGLSLYLAYNGNEKVAVNVILSLLDEKYCKIIEKDMEERVFLPNNFDNPESWGFPQFVTHKYLLNKRSGLLKDDKLKILCKITFKPDFVTFAPDLVKPELKLTGTKDNNDQVSVSKYKLQILDDFEKLFENELYSDVTVSIGENKLELHKAILTSRSPVFDAMFKHEMKEKENNNIEITDVNYDVMKEVLRFMYTSKVKNIEKIAKDLLIAAEKYSVEGLKKLCEETLYKSLNCKNAIESLKLADMCNATQLKSQVIAFISHKQTAITAAPEFNLFGNLHSELQCELVRALVAHNSTNDCEMSVSEPSKSELESAIGQEVQNNIDYQWQNYLK